MGLNRWLLGAGLCVVACSNSASATLIGNDINGNLYDINLATGAATETVSTGISGLVGIAFNGSGVLYGLSFTAVTESLYRINPTTGASTLIGSSSVVNQFTDNFSGGDLRFDPATGTLIGIGYVTATGGAPPAITKGFTIDSSTGAISNFFNLPCFNNSCVVEYDALAIDQTGKAYILDTASLDPYGHLVVANADPYSELSNVNLNHPLGEYAGMDIDPTTGELYVADGGTSGGSLYTLNPTTGALTLIGGLGDPDGISGLAFAPSVPEPGSLALLALGGLGALVVRFRRILVAEVDGR